MIHHKNSLFLYLMEKNPVQFIFIFDGKWKARTLWSWLLPYFSFLERDILCSHLFPSWNWKWEIPQRLEKHEQRSSRFLTLHVYYYLRMIFSQELKQHLPLPEQPRLRGQWLNWAEKTPQLWLSLDQHSFLECLCTKKSRKQAVLTPSNTAGRLCRHSSWTFVEKKRHLVVPKGALAENS